MNNCGITLTSQIFGCKGLKGDLEIIDINSNKKIINKNNIDFRFLNMNIKFWMNKILFNNAENLECHLDLVLKVKLSHHYIREFKRFLKYYEDKIILIGGKKSIGFGFVKLATDDILTDVSKIETENQKYIWDKIELKSEDIAEDKEILGFSFKYLIRKKEHKYYREDNFGKKGQGSRFYFSNVVREGDRNYVYMIGLLEGTHEEKTIFKRAFKKYLKEIKEVK